MKNLSAAEMYDQVENLASIASEEYDVNLSNIVYMGMGEPLLNYSNVLESVREFAEHLAWECRQKELLSVLQGLQRR